LTQHMDTRLKFVESRISRKPEVFCSVVGEGLSAPQKWLHCRYFYDEAGSRLFELICDLPEYYLTRTERSILERYASDILAAAGDVSTLVEFGSGSGCKTRILLEAAFESAHDDIEYIPIDISGEFLYNSARLLLNDYQALRITAIAAEYNDAIALLPPTSSPRLFLFMGSNIGNFAPAEAAAFLERVRLGMNEQDRLLVGLDLHKDASVLEPAYNDPLGLTAQFNKNLLARINRELEADFNLDLFDHHAPFIESRSRIEMRLISIRDQEVHIGALGRRFSFSEGEFIHTENSHKYTINALTDLAAGVGLELMERWTDERGWFALGLFKRTSPRDPFKHIC
jgi:L-histidine N-alpha-methyltransferase